MMEEIILNKYGVGDRQPFSVSETRDDNVKHYSLHVVDKDGNVAFTVWAFPSADGAEFPFNEEELWERTRNLLSYFNFQSDNPFGEFS